jgi:hypothetical protein
MPKQSSTEVKLEFICREIKELKEEQKQLRADINKGKGCYMVITCYFWNNSCSTILL